MFKDNMYVLRYVLVPQEPRQKRLDLLLKFCDKARIDEVMFFIMPEEYNIGQCGKQYYQPWLDFAAKAREALESTGRSVSLNPWYTLYSVDRGRRSEGMDYRRMVLENGDECLSVACPLCSNWKKLFLESFTDYAQAGFKTIWIEDDWRFHNHSDSGIWGGCFCDEHMKILQQRGVVAKDRTELVRNLNAKGIVHPDRRIWRDLNAQTHVELASSLRLAMDAVDTSINIGLMTSHISQHTREGRYWHKLIDAFGGIDRVPVRPHASGYQESCQRDSGLMANLSETLSCLPDGTRTFFEIENFPMSSFVKSNQQTVMHMAQSIEGSCDGVTLDVLDFIGTGPASEPKMAETLAGCKDKLLELREFVTGSTPVAINAILPDNTTDVAPGTGEPDIFKVPSIDYGWFTFLQAQGYPCVNSSTIGTIDPDDQMYALSGHAVWAIPDDKLKTILETCKLLLDCEAVNIILQRNMGSLIGIKSAAKYYRCSHNYSMEEHLDISSDQIPERATLNPTQGDSFVCAYDLTASAVARTVIKDCFDEIVGPATVMYSNASGGSGIVLPFDLPCSHMYYNWIRKKWLDRWLLEICKEPMVPSVINAPWMSISAREKQGVFSLFLANQIFEIHEQLQVSLPMKWRNLDWTVVSHSRDQEGPVCVKDGVLQIETQICGNDWITLRGSAS